MYAQEPALRHGATTGQLYVSAFQAHGESLALVGDGIALSYAQLAEQSCRMARLFQARGLQRQDVIAFLVGNRAEAVCAIIAAQLANLKSVALHPLASEEDHAFVLADSGAKALVADTARFEERVRRLQTRGSIDAVLPLDDGALGPGLARQAATMEASMLVPSGCSTDIYKLSYTGGTTGRSKGILHTHRTAVTMLTQMLATYEWPAQIRYLVTTPISHAAGSLILPVLLRGGTVYLSDKFSPADFMQRVQAQRINMSFLVPTQIYGLLDHPNLAAADLSSLELVLYGAAPISPTRLQEAIERIGPVFAQVYGQAEAPMTISYLSKRDHDLKHPQWLRSCGRAIVGNQIQLLDRQLKEVPTGEIGELCVRSPLVMEGYLNRPEENDKVFEGDWLHTGDMAYSDETGHLYLVDRAKDMIISGGFNVYPSEVEHCLAQHPAVAMAAVFGVPDAKWGEAVNAIVVLKLGHSLEAAQVIQYVTDKKGVVNAPKVVRFAAELPLTALGKIDRKTLKNQHWGGQDRQIA